MFLTSRRDAANGARPSTKAHSGITRTCPGLPSDHRATTWAFLRELRGVNNCESARHVIGSGSGALPLPAQCAWSHPILVAGGLLGSEVAPLLVGFFKHGICRRYVAFYLCGHLLHPETAVQSRSAMVMHATHGVARGMVRGVGGSLVCRIVTAGQAV